MKVVTISIMNRNLLSITRCNKYVIHENQQSVIRDAKLFMRNYNISLVKIFKQFCSTRSSVIELTSTRQLSLSRARYSTLSPPSFSHLNSLRYILTLCEIMKLTLRRSWVIRSGWMLSEVDC